ncbi:MAG: putative membrane protein, partial [Glaciecola sp.]
ATVVLGIINKKQHLRIGAIILFAVTLIKLFLYDISHLDTIAKTIVFMSLGVLLLIVSFLYNKYKHIISDES